MNVEPIPFVSQTSQVKNTGIFKNRDVDNIMRHSLAWSVFRFCQDPHGEVKKLAQFLGRDLTDELIADIVRMTSIDVMRKATGKNQEEQKFFDSIYKDGKNKMIRKGN